VNGIADHVENIERRQIDRRVPAQKTVEVVPAELVEYDGTAKGVREPR
jgi:hypothetical protein